MKTLKAKKSGSHFPAAFRMCIVCTFTLAKLFYKKELGLGQLASNYTDYTMTPISLP
ncbi:hypothetical protein SAMD00020551_1500 [Mesobacillus selenatarsenatis SF-1]|uniref:Uncharacterized protein n=1 Tax=Mesobacillus selenatarsenatis (strain DSM 18680 / JCM 14380 / FERM P-15431 / SF-1) TaxID=1321606 RepID=A0A0A8X0C0_MESS1|nr:hypothetical protein SAMD00020551_1500 [Mesobacillus selenatarsenatis SF-1]